MREPLSHKYITGSGTEIGGLHFPLPVLPGVKVSYVDRATLDVVAKDHGDVNIVKNEIIVDDGEHLAKFENDSQDFVIANHVLEHCHDPIGTLFNWSRVLKKGGIIYAAVPNKDFTFDKNRAVTTLEHVFLDYQKGITDETEALHYHDWHYHIDGMRGEELEKRIASDVANKQNIHFHVWDLPAMVILFQKFIEVNKQMELCEYVIHGAEVIWILRKK